MADVKYVLRLKAYNLISVQKVTKPIVYDDVPKSGKEKKGKKTNCLQTLPLGAAVCVIAVVQYVEDTMPMVGILCTAQWVQTINK